MTQLKKFLSSLVLVLKDTRKAYAKRHLNHLLGS
jgi:hypothetical protein